MKLIKELTEATAFKRLGNHKGILTRTVNPSETKPDDKKWPVKKVTVQEKLNKIIQIIDNAISMSIPDGDPGDHIFKKVGYYLGIPSYNVRPWLDRAVKESTRDKDINTYDEYVAYNWDAYWESQTSTLEEYKEKVKRNPWR
jgi:hypothetical protein